MPQAEPAALVYRKVYLGEVFIAGFRFHDGMRPAVLAGLNVGDELDLCREPQNPYDENAIAVYDRQRHHLGYVPCHSNDLPARLADQSVGLGAEISGLEPDASPWERVRIRLYQRVAEPAVRGA
jgi:hypothetical protein